MNKDVKIKDRDVNIEYLRLALNMAGIGANYIVTDLINKLFEEVKNKKGKFSIKDSVTIECEWERKWKKHFEVKENH